MSEVKNEMTTEQSNRRIWIFGGLGFLLCGVITFNAMPSLVIVTREGVD